MQTSTTTPQDPKPKPEPNPTPKARPLPPTHRPAKRPLLHPPQTPRTIYISSRTPFVSAVKRAQRFLDTKSTTNITTTKGKGKGAADTKSAKAAKNVDVTLKASGKAIDMTLQVALYFQSQSGYVVRIRTGVVGVVDDVVRVGGEVGGFGVGGFGVGTGTGTGAGKRKGEGEGEGERMEGVEEEEMDDITMRERRISTIEIVISVKEVAKTNN